jgi:hypothetical protein
MNTNAVRHLIVICDFGTTPQIFADKYRHSYQWHGMIAEDRGIQRAYIFILTELSDIRAEILYSHRVL